MVCAVYGSQLFSNLVNLCLHMVSKDLLNLEFPSVNPGYAATIGTAKNWI